MNPSSPRQSISTLENNETYVISNSQTTFFCM